ncbi:hypothetical protein BV25DRAFT_1992045 [Artomyces pyxidatus]|uniref:Uncharacterized protein n=1 Tax=Artomyces pyxidatus TaxID=48021 RepID=A0ACB8SZS8_9AGAM|nr:hypothetical protein BV25DRAFT_1992045 [Artomyces pyxidatus]
MSFSLGARFRSFLPSFSRSFNIYKDLRKSIPPQRDSISTPEAFLKAIGRASETKVTYEKWGDLWKVDGAALKKAGLPVRDRRYILWAMEKYRQGLDPADFSHERKPKKKIRGWGPAVQNGKRIRSRRHT